ncbi:MAG: DHA2 family efflux MFS transporter permease subunit [Gammaproteobacteria bacterium]|nr:MAG: DHA2 family efflux MFS transporter permease subunit [Gammaproteobacteria bacterium]UTW42597.1 MFS transporter [bacterium SCSIO 12844]
MNITKEKPSKSAWFSLLGISLISFLGCIDFTIVDTALPSIQENLNVTVTQLQWVVNIFLLALTAFMVVMGKLGDHHGHRRILYIGMGLFALSSIGAGLSPSINWLLFSRLIQGISIAITYTIPVAIIPSLFPDNYRGKATGILFGANGFGLALGPVVGGIILSVLSWRWIFLVNPIIIIIGFMFCYFHLPKDQINQDQKSIDWWGLLLLMIISPCIVFATVQGSHWGWTSVPVLSLYALSIILLIAFYQIESKIKDPIINFKLFNNALFRIGLSANFLLAFFYTLAFFLMPLYLHNIHHLSGYKIGLALLPASLMVAILSPVVGSWLHHSGPKVVLACGFFLFACSAFMQIFFSSQTQLWFIELSFLLFGIGWALIVSPSFVVALSTLPKEIGGVAMGTLGTLHNFGGALGLALGTVIYSHFSFNQLISGLKTLHIQTGSWVTEAIADPNNATSLISSHIKFGYQHAQQLFEDAFIKGYSSSMWLLLIVALLGLAIIVIFEKSKQH